MEHQLNKDGRVANKLFELFDDTWNGLWRIKILQLDLQ